MPHQVDKLIEQRSRSLTGSLALCSSLVSSVLKKLLTEFASFAIGNRWLPSGRIVANLRI
jgi:hypothetical protein